ncbi:MAG TPA: hypothetical protein PKI02_16645, partial [Mycobacterium sp.]|nr:hypothetical protein [Mycobacterium sp.]
MSAITGAVGHVFVAELGRFGVVGFVDGFGVDDVRLIEKIVLERERVAGVGHGCHVERFVVGWRA